MDNKQEESRTKIKEQDSEDVEKFHKLVNAKIEVFEKQIHLAVKCLSRYCPICISGQ